MSIQPKWSSKRDGLSSRWSFIMDLSVQLQGLTVAGDQAAVNPKRVGTKCAAHYVVSVASEQEVTIRVRVYHHLEKPSITFSNAFTAVMEARKEEADCFYEEVSC